MRLHVWGLGSWNAPTSGCYFHRGGGQLPSSPPLHVKLLTSPCPHPQQLPCPAAVPLGDDPLKSDRNPPVNLTLLPSPSPGCASLAALVPPAALPPSPCHISLSQPPATLLQIAAARPRCSTPQRRPLQVECALLAALVHAHDGGAAVRARHAGIRRRAHPRCEPPP